MTIQEKPAISLAEQSAQMWGLGGRYYDDVSFAISDAIGHAVQRLDARRGETILDIATGTGWAARLTARKAARVTGVDISDGMLDAARALSAHVDPPIAFRRADAEDLPFADGAFDRILSTFGVMFASDRQRAAAEMARVCRPDGRLVLATWIPGGAVDAFFGVIAGHSDVPPPPVSPMAWGEPAEVEKLLGADFDLTFETGVNNACHEDEDAIWDWYVRGFGPLKQLADSLPDVKRAALKRDVDAYHAHYMTPAGLRVRRDYLIVIGRRR